MYVALVRSYCASAIHARRSRRTEREQPHLDYCSSRVGTIPILFQWSYIMRERNRKQSIQHLRLDSCAPGE